MAVDATKQPLTGGTRFLPILITTTASTGDIIHQPLTNATIDQQDELFLYAHNDSALDAILSIDWGDGTFVEWVTIPARQGLFQIDPGAPDSSSDGSNNTIRMFASVANVIRIKGWVNRVINL